MMMVLWRHCCGGPGHAEDVDLIRTTALEGPLHHHHTTAH
jgi:hypothetical protein